MKLNSGYVGFILIGDNEINRKVEFSNKLSRRVKQFVILIA